MEKSVPTFSNQKCILATFAIICEPTYLVNKGDQKMLQDRPQFSAPELNHLDLRAFKKSIPGLFANPGKPGNLGLASWRQDLLDTLGSCG